MGWPPVAFPGGGGAGAGAGAVQQVEREKGEIHWRPDRPLVPSAVLFLCGPFWALFRKVPGVPGWRSV